MPLIIVNLKRVLVHGAMSLAARTMGGEERLTRLVPSTGTCDDHARDSHSDANPASVMGFNNCKN